MFRAYDKRFYQLNYKDCNKEYKEVTIYDVKENEKGILFLIYNQAMKEWEYVDADNFEEINYGCDSAYYGI